MLQIAPLDADSRFDLSGGFGTVSGHDAETRSGKPKVSGWWQAQFAIRTPIHELAPFVQIGGATVSGSKTELMVGIAHPLAPYHFHLF